MNNVEIESAVGGDDFDSDPGNNEFFPPELAQDDKILDGDTNSPQDDDPDEDDYDPARIVVTQIYDLALVKSLTENVSYIPGDTVPFRIYVHNQGTLPATDVTLKDHIPSGFLLIDPSWLPFDSTYTFVNPIAPQSIDSIDLNLRIDPAFAGSSLINNAEILFASGGVDEDSSPGNNGNDAPELAQNDKITDGDTGSTIDDDPDEDDFDPEQVFVNRFDLALKKTIPSGLEGPYNLFTDINFEVTVYNQGNAPIGEFTITDYVPAGLKLSSSDVTWTEVNDSIATYTSSSRLQPGDSIVLPLVMMLSPEAYSQPTQEYINVAEISEMKDTFGLIIDDIDSDPDSIPDNDVGGEANGPSDDVIDDDGTFDEDDSDPALVYSVSIDPLGYIYCEKTGEIITGGTVSVTGPGNVFFSVDTLGNTLDGSGGFYQFLVDMPGDYMITYTHPDGYPLSTTCLPLTSPFNPNPLDGTAIDKDGVINGELVLGSDAAGGILIDASCSYNSYFMGVSLDPASPPVISNNNIPVQCIQIGAAVCEDFNADGVHDTPLEGYYSGENVYLHYCADTINPIDSAVTDFSGNFNFSLLRDSCYRLRFEVPTGRFISISNNVNAANGWSNPINLTFGECDTTTTICLAPCNVSCIPVGSDPTSCLSSDGTITISPSGGLGVYDYSLDNINFQSSNIFTGLGPGSYTVYTRDISGCVGQCSVVLDSPSGIACSVVPTDPTCSTDLGIIAVTGFGGSGNYEYSLDSGAYQSLDTFFNVTEGFHTITVRDVNDLNCTSTCSATITIPSPISCTITANNPTCSTGFGSINVVGSGGSNAYEYSLDGGPFQLNSLFTSVSEGAHTITIRDLIDSTCTSTCMTTLTAPPALTCNAIPTNPTCFGGTGSINVIGSGGNGSYEYSLNGSPFQSSGLFDSVFAGLHTITIRDSLDVSCINTCVITLDNPTALSCTAVASDPTCSSGTGSITVTGAGGSGNHQYSLDGVNFQINNTFIGLTPNTYTITTRDANDFSCTTTCMATIGNPIPLTCSISVTDPICSTDLGILEVTAMGGSGTYEYSMDSGPFQPGNVFSNATDGPHTITVRDVNDIGCTTTCSATVTAPPPLSCIALPTNPTCYDGLGVVNVSGLGGSGSYFYSLDGGPSQTSGIFINVTDGTHTVTVIDQIDPTCTSSCGVLIEIPDSIGCSITVTNPSCSGGLGTIEVTGFGGSGVYLYSIDNGTPQTSGVFSNQLPGPHTVQVFDLLDNSCMSSCDAEIINPVPVSCSTSVTNPTCSGILGTITVHAEGGSGTYRYSLDGGAYQTDSVFTNVTNGSHTITVQDITDPTCTSTCGATIVIPLPISCSAIPTNPTCGNGSGTITVNPSGGSGVYQYSIDGINFGNNNVFMGLSSGSYTVTIRDSLDFSCTSTCTADILVPVALSCTTVVTDPECAGGTGSITVMASGGSNNYEYSLDGGPYVGSNVFTGVSPGTHMITVRDQTDNSCTTTCDAIIADPAPISCSITAVNPTCNVTTGSLIVHASGGSGTYEYSLDGINFVNDSVFSGLTTGIYDVTVRDAVFTSCVSTCQDSITELVPLTCTATPTDPLCGDGFGSINIVASGGSGVYEYSINGGPFVSSEDFTGLSNGSYNIVVRDQSDTLCSTSCSADIIVPPLMTCTATSNDPNCSDELGTISVEVFNNNGNYNISWQLSSGGPIMSDVNVSGIYNITDLGEGDWDITITDAIGCTTTCTANIDIPEPFTCSATPNNPDCYSGLGSILVDITGPTDSYLVQWEQQGVPGIFSQNNVVDTFTIKDLVPATWIITITNTDDCQSTCMTTIIEPPLLTCEVDETTDITCFGANNGAVRIRGIGGSGDLIYGVVGIGFNSTGIFENLPPGSYIGTVGDISGCVSECPFTIVGPTSLSCTASVLNPVTCAGGDDGEILIAASGGTTPYTYRIGSIQNMNGEFDGLSAGAYTVEVEDANGCITTCDVLLATPNDDLECDIELISGPSCSGATDAEIRVNGDGGQAPYTYQLGIETNTTGIFSGLGAGTWSVFIFDDNGCANYCTIEIDDPNTLTCSITVVNEISCRDADDAILQVEVVGGQAPYRYSRNGSDFQSSSVFDDVGSGTSVIEVMDDNGCITRCQVYLENPAEFFCLLGEVDQISCEGETDGGFQAKGCEGVEPYEYSLNGGKFSEVNQWSDLAPGEYVVVVRDARGCESTCDLLLLEPEAIVCNIEQQIDPSCEENDGIIEISASGGVGTLSFQLNDGPIQASGLFENLVSGSYDISIHDENNCIKQCTTIVLENPNELESSIQIVDGTMCGTSEGPSINTSISGGTPPYEYSLDGGPFVGTGVFDDLSIGAHTVTVRDANGCISMSTIEITDPNQLNCTVTNTTDTTCDDPFGGEVTIVAGGGSGTLTFTLSTGQSNNSGLFTGLVAGSYTVTIEDINGCTTSCDFEIILNADDTPDAELICNSSYEYLGCNPSSIPSPQEYIEAGGVEALNGSVVVLSSDVTVDGCIHTAEYVYRAVNACGSFSGTSCTVTLEWKIDSVAPELPSIENEITVSCMETPSVVLTATDNCGEDIMTIGQDQIIEGDCDNEYTIIRSWTFIDDCGNTSVLSQTINVVDNDGPELSLMPLDSTVSDLSEVPDSPVITAVDECEGIVIVEESENILQNECGGTVTRIWIATDACGNATSHTQVISIVPDNTISCEVVSTTDADCNTNNGAVELTTIGGSGSYTYSINGIVNSTGIFTGLMPGSYIIDVEDNNGCGTSTCTFLILTKEGEAPEIACNFANNDINLGCNPINVPSAQSLIDDGLISTSQGASIDIEVINEEMDGCEHSVTYGFRAIDECGHPSLEMCFLTYRWTEDVTAPVINTELEDITVFSSQDVPQNTVIEVTDDCGATLESFTEDRVEEDCGYALHRQWIFADNCGNQDSISQIVYVRECGDSTFIDLELVKEVSKTEVEIDETVTFTISITNKGNTEANDVGFIDYLPGGYYDVSNISNGGTEIGATIVWSGFDLSPQESISVTFDAKVSEPLTGISYKNIAEVLNANQEDVDSDYGNDNGDQSEDDEDYAEVTIITPDDYVDISLVKEVSDQSPDIRDVVTYTITIRNDGTIAATDVEVTDYLPVDYCSEFINISEGGILIDDEIIWSDIDLQPGESIELTFDAVVSSSAHGQNVNNTAEVTGHNEPDVDSTPDNGDESEDDQDSVVFTVGNVSDLELNKRIVNTDAQVGDTVTFEIELFNNGPDPVAFAEVEDVIPDGYADYSNISHNGQTFTNRILWITQNLAANESVVFTFDARVVHFPNEECDYRNVAQVTRSTSSDPDSEPNNDDGDQSEDDEDGAELFIGEGDTSCVNIETAVLLEGAYNFKEGRMHTKLNDLGYLPGQEPVTFFGTRTESGHPYFITPWNYLGTEGEQLNSNLPELGDFAGYPGDAVDYVLVGLRTDVSPDSTVCERVALVLQSGDLYFFDDDNCCDVDRNREYYIVIQHRNHLPVMSHVKVPIINGRMSYDFRIQNSYVNALGFGQKEVDNGRFAMYAGNGDQIMGASSDVDINIRDLNVWLMNDGNNSSYYLRDYDLNGDVNVQDKALFLRNNGIFSDVRMK